MKILVTGAKGFIGKNLIAELKNRGHEDILECSRTTPPEQLDQYTQQCDFVYHLAGVNRPIDENDFIKENLGFTTILLASLQKHNNKSTILMTSSTQAELDNPYGKSKKTGEDALFQYGREQEVRVLVYRLPNVFGKWCKPNYNSAVATFCHNIASGLPIQVNDPMVQMNLVYIDDVVSEFIIALDGKENKLDQFCFISPVHTVQLGQIVKLVQSFRSSRNERDIPNLADAFTKKLYSTYLSYLPKDMFSYPLKMNVDNRGSFTEFIKTPDRGQVSINISKPGITKGNHWHNTKNEKFLVVSGTGIIRFRKIDGNEIIEYKVSGEKLAVLDIPPGYTHSISNLGETDMVTVMWVNEIFDPEKPDTCYAEV